MPWNNQNGGGGWKGGGGGPWGQPPKGPSGGGGNQPPDLEELLRRGQETLRGWLPGGGGPRGGAPGGFGASGIALAVVAASALWLLTGFYRVEPDELGIEMVLGKVAAQTTPGLNYNIPYPIGQVFTPKVLAVREITVGQREVEYGRGMSPREPSDPSLMLTGDENLVDITFKVQWNVKDATAYQFNIKDPETTVKVVAESAMREVIGKNNIELVLTSTRQVETDVRDLMQKVLDDYRSGIEIRLVNMWNVNPPAQVIDAFRDVQAARQDADRLQNEAHRDANKLVPEARGAAEAIKAQAQAYRQRTVEEARGQADRFSQVLAEYRHAPEVTRQRLYIETMERVFTGVDKVLIDQGKGEGAIQPYLPLDQLTRSKAQPRTGGQP